MTLLKSRFFAACAFAGIAGLSAWLYLNQREDELLRRSKIVKVISAKHYLSAYSRIKAGDLEWRDIPAEYIVKGYVTQSADAIGQLSLVAFNADEPLTYNKISAGNASLANSIPEGMRAISIPVDKVSGIGGMIRPGDLVDVLYLEDPKKSGTSAAILFQAVKVLAAGDYFSEHQEKTDPNGTVTLALSPDDAQIAVLAFNHGILQLSLRSSGDGHLFPSKATRVEDIRARLSRHSDFAPADGPLAAPSEFIPKKR